MVPAALAIDPMNAKSINLLAMLSVTPAAAKYQTAIVVLAVLAAIVLLLMAIVFVISRSREPDPCYFPEPISQPRLGAPYGGGNQAIRDLGPPLPRS